MPSPDDAGVELQRTIHDVTDLVCGQLEQCGRPDTDVLAALRPLDRAGPDDVAALYRAEYTAAAEQSAAGCLLVGDQVPIASRSGRAIIRVADPEQAVDRMAETWGPAEPDHPPAGVHPSAVVEAGAEVDPSAAVGPLVFVGSGARVGARTRLLPGAYLGPQASIGCDGVLHPQVVVGSRCRLGDRVTVFGGTVIGADGFGYRQGDDGLSVKVPHVGHVIVGDDVEIGANSSIDRGRLDATQIGDGCKIDNHVHVAHNCVLGRGVVIAGHTTMAGSARIEDFVLVGGGARLNGHITVGRGAKVGGCAAVTKDVEPGVYVAGFPARPGSQWAREMASLTKLPDALRTLRQAVAGRGALRDADDRGTGGDGA